jgi:hypothetical protein
LYGHHDGFLDLTIHGKGRGFLDLAKEVKISAWQREGSENSVAAATNPRPEESE